MGQGGSARRTVCVSVASGICVGIFEEDYLKDIGFVEMESSHI